MCTESAIIPRPSKVSKSALALANLEPATTDVKTQLDVWNFFNKFYLQMMPWHKFPTASAAKDWSMRF